MKQLNWKAGIAGMVLAASATTVAAQNVELRFAHWLPGGHPLAKTGFEPWAESLTKASGGTIKVAFFPAQQLGSASDHHDMARDGIADITFTNMGYQPGRFPVAGAGEMPFLVSDSVAGSRVFHDWYSQFAAKEVEGVKTCMVHLQPSGALHSKKPITHPDHLKGMTLRPPSAFIGRFFAQLGASNVQVGAPQARETLARGTADALGFPWDSIATFKIDEVVDHHLDMPLYVNVFGIMMNQNAYDRLNADQKKAVDDHCTPEWSAKLMSLWNENNLKVRQRFRDDPARTVTVPSDDELAAWRKAAEQVREDWAADVKKAGHDPDALWADLTKRLDEAGALYK